MAIENSRNLLVYVGSVGDSPLVVLDKQTNSGIDLSAGQIDVSNKTDQNFGAKLADLRDFNVTADVAVNWPDTNGFEKVRSEATAGNDVDIQVAIDSADRRYSATCAVLSLNITGGNRDATRAQTSFALSQGAPTFA